ncbi:hypothetical protein BDQ17DRAFT_1039458 [Cyathus striatus]|nr:hypothetical protein BDQ17DRAFT_1039458 [Cyathus striatus]
MLATGAVYIALFSAILTLLLSTLQTLNTITLVRGAIVLMLLSAITLTATRESVHPHNSAPYRTGSVLRDSGCFKGVWCARSTWLRRLLCVVRLLSLLWGCAIESIYCVLAPILGSTKHIYLIFPVHLPVLILPTNVILHGFLLLEQQKQVTLLQTYIFTRMLFCGCYWVLLSAWAEVWKGGTGPPYGIISYSSPGGGSRRFSKPMVPVRKRMSGALDEESADESIPLIRRVSEVEWVKGEREEGGTIV